MRARVPTRPQQGQSLAWTGIAVSFGGLVYGWPAIKVLAAGVCVARSARNGGE
jgi:hypothetical protein